MAVFNDEDTKILKSLAIAFGGFSALTVLLILVSRFIA